MREVLYRAISMARGEHWLFGQPRHYARSPHTEKWTIYDPETGIETDIDEDTLGQYTGRTDVDDDKIFEGDVLTATIFDYNGHDTMHTVIVEWNEKYAQYMCVDVNDKDYMWDLGWIILNDGEPLIVGNRWDNPSLLKGGKQ
jgi:uncharacterized phage protein (TIGR01671 family)